MFTAASFETLLFKGRSVLSTAQRGTVRERIEVSVKNQKVIRVLFKLLEK